MSLANEVYWSYIHNHFQNIAVQYGFSPAGYTAVSIASLGDGTTSPIDSSSPSYSPRYAEPNASSSEYESLSSTSSSPPPSPADLPSPANDECSCGFDGCGGFCAGLPDTTSDARSGAEEDSQPTIGTSYTDEDTALDYWPAAHEAHAITALVNMYLAAPGPQASVDSIPCETEFEVRLWGKCVKGLRARRAGGQVRGGK